MSGSRTEPAQHHFPLGFRADIQGLRALAVLLVILSHLRVPGFPGGYVGVDVFFVISGFLITGLLLREVHRKGRVSLLDFYARRARRILPAASLVGIATVVASLLFLPLLRVQTIIVDSLWTSVFAANIRFALVGTDYFAQGEPPSPFRHYWSLAVEEQFYLVWPLLVLLWALWRRRGGSERSLPIALGGLMVASLAWSVLATESSPTTAYFSTLTRAWELGIGAGLALLLSRSRLRPSPLGGLLLSLLGAAAVAWTTLFFGPETPFPGVAALLPTLGTAALILGGSHTDARNPIDRLLECRPAVAIGDWSYSLYLWHWPIITIARQHFGIRQFTPLQMLILLVTTFVLSWLTYRYVETPFREGRRWRVPRMSVAIYPATVLLAIAVAGGGTLWINQQLGAFGDEPAIRTSDYTGQAELADDEYVALVQASVLAARADRPVPSKLTPSLVGLRQQVAPLGECDYRTGTTELCPEGDPSATRSIVVLGDSHARAWSPAFTTIGAAHGYRVYTLVYSGCAAIGYEQLERGTDHAWTACTEFKDWARDQIAELHPDLVAVASSGATVIDPENGEIVGRAHPDRQRYLRLLRDGYAAELSALKPLADRVYLIGNTPRLPRESGVCLSQGNPTLGDCAFAPTKVADKMSRASLAAAKDAGVGRVNARPWFCYDGLCPAVVGSFITMRDKEHITPAYAEWLADPLARALRLDRD